MCRIKAKLVYSYISSALRCFSHERRLEKVRVVVEIQGKWAGLTSDFSAPPIRTKSVIPHHLSLALWSELTNRMWQKWQCAKCKPGPQETLARLCSSPLCPDGWHRPASQRMRPAAALQPKASQPSLWVSLDESVVSCPLSWPQHNWQKAQLRSTQPGLDP